MTSKDAGIKQKVLHGLFWVSSLTTLGQIFTWCVTLIVIRLLRPEDYGIMAMATYFIGILRLLNEAGLATAIIQKQEISTEQIRKVAGFVLVVNSVLAVISVVSAGFIADFFSEPRLVPVIRLLSINFLLMSLCSVQQAFILRNLNFKYKATVDFTSNLLSTILVLVLAFLGFGFWSLVWGTIFRHLGRAIGFNLRKELRCTPIFSLKGMGAILRFGGHVTLTRILWYFYSQADILIAGRLLGKNALGVYAIALRLVMLPMEKISPVFNQISLPAFSRVSNKPGTLQKHFLWLTRMLSIVFMPIFFGLSVVAPEIVPLLLGEKWRAAVLPIQILCFVMPIRMVGLLFPSIITAVGRQEVMTGNMAVGCLVMPVCFLIGSQWGVQGICYAWLLGYPLLFVFMATRTLRILEISWGTFLRPFLLPVSAALVMVLGMMMLKMTLADMLSPLWSGILLISGGALIYGATILLIDSSLWHEVKTLSKSRTSWKNVVREPRSDALPEAVVTHRTKKGSNSV